MSHVYLPVSLSLVLCHTSRELLVLLVRGWIARGRWEGGGHIFSFHMKYANDGLPFKLLSFSYYLFRLKTKHGPKVEIPASARERAMINQSIILSSYEETGDGEGGRKVPLALDLPNPKMVVSRFRVLSNRWRARHFKLQVEFTRVVLKWSAFQASLSFGLVFNRDHEKSLKKEKKK